MTDLFIKLVNMSITAGWLTLAVVIFRLFFKKAPKWINCILWGMVGIRLVLPFSIKSVLSLIPSTQTIPGDIIYAKEPHIYTGVSALNSTINPVLSQSMAATPEYSANPMQIFMAVASQVWIVGIILMLIYAIFSYLRIYLKIKESLEIKKGIYLCDRVSAPFIFGVIKPKIIILSSMKDEDMEYVIAHEISHIKRLDHIWKPLGFLLLSVYWFNPVLWLAYIFLCRDIELACDEKVVARMNDEEKKAYSNALINCSSRQRLVSACPVAFGEVGVKGRIKSVLNYKKPAFWIIIVALIMCIAAGVFFLTDPLDKDIEGSKERFFRGTIISVYNDSILVKVDEEYTHLVSDKTFVPTVNIDYPIFEENRRVAVRYNGEIQESYPTTVKGVMSVAYIDEEVLSIYPENSNVYVYKNSPDPMEPTIRLSNVDNRFSFSYSAYSSFIARGEYEVKGSELILKCDDSDVKYVFIAEDGGYVFDEKNSSPIPEYKYSSDAEAKACVPDKAKFEFDRHETPLDFLYTDYDIDNDGEKERISLSYGPTSGIFSFYLTVAKNGETLCKDLYSYYHGEMSFEENEKGGLCLKVEESFEGEVYILDIVMENGHACLYDNGVNIGYLYCNTAEEFSYKLDMLYETEGKGVAVSHPQYHSAEVEAIKNERDAIIESHKYVTVKYDQVTVAYDKDADIWRICYNLCDTAGGDQSIYIPSDRSVITSVYGE
ncbi:MAG: hypothetical protein IKU52_05930 [Clostridia bacterium]|nr:hypothetical protein [Clostridia bacterium]